MERSPTELRVVSVTHVYNDADSTMTPIATLKVHEAKGALFQSKHRYFISIDDKFRQMDVDGIGMLGGLGDTKSEATEKVQELGTIISRIKTVLNYAKAGHMAMTREAKAILVQRNEDELVRKITGKYVASLDLAGQTMGGE